MKSKTLCNANNRSIAGDATDFTSMTRKDGMNQTAFKGWPLYHYSKDMKSGDVKGQAFKDIWFVVNPMKFPPK
jgi:predicted lipoprotein with Yx(FWY)xxD motif